MNRLGKEDGLLKHFLSCQDQRPISRGEDILRPPFQCCRKIPQIVLTIDFLFDSVFMPDV